MKACQRVSSRSSVNLIPCKMEESKKSEDSLSDTSSVVEEIRTVLMANYCITGLWISLSIILTTSVVFSMLSPVWFQNFERHTHNINETGTYVGSTADVVVSFGILRYCTENDINDLLFRCSFYAGLSDMPSLVWLICTVVYSIGAGLLMIGVILTTFGICLNEERGKKLRIGVAYIQVCGVGFLGVSILLFPAGLDSPFVQEICGTNATFYMSGQCQVAWGYVVAIMSIAMTIFCPILAKYSTEEKIQAHSYTGVPTHSKVITTV